MSITLSPVPCTGGSCGLKRLADYEPLAKICSSFLLDLFVPPPTLGLAADHYDSLPYFIALAFSQSQLPDTNALAALTLLQRLKSNHPTRAFSSSGLKHEAERLFLSSYIAATKVLSDDRYRLQFWVKVGQNKFAVEELSQMEKEFFEDLDWDVRIDDATLAIFQLLVERQKQLLEKNRSQDSWSSRSSSTGSSSSSSSGSSSDTSDTSNSSGSSSSDSVTSSSFPSTPSDLSIAHAPSISPLLQHRIRESDQNLAALDQRIEALQQQFDSLMQKPANPGLEGSGAPHHGTRHMIKEKIRHVFKS